MGIEILVSKSSDSNEIEKAYQTMAFAYRTTIVDYARKNKISVLELAKNSGCEYPIEIEQFVNEGCISATGLDLDRLIDRVEGKGIWLNKIKNVQIHASTLNAEPANYLERDKLDKESDLTLREAINKMSWFYMESVNRFLLENQEI